MIELLFQQDMKTFVFIVPILIFCLRYFDSKVLFIFFIVCFLFIYSETIEEKLMNITKKPSKKMIENNKKVKREIDLNVTISDLLHSLKRYKKYNPPAYNEGYKLFKNFMFTINDLEKDDISHPRQYFENAYSYLQGSINLFQSISISVPEESYIHSLKYNEKKPSRLSNEIGKLCKELYIECYYLLYNLSLRHNQDWFKNPDYLKNEIQMTINESNHYESEYELY